MNEAMWVTVCSVLAVVVVVLGILLRREQQASGELRDELTAAQRQAAQQQQQQAAQQQQLAQQHAAQQHAAQQQAAPPPPPGEEAEHDRRRHVRSAQEAVNGTVRRMQALGNEAGDRIQTVLHSHGPDVFQALLPVDHVVAQMQRRLQVLAVLCGSWPGQQRSSAELADVVRGAQSRIHDYSRVRVAAPDEKTAVIGRAVEPVGMALAELLDNSTRSSPPSAAVDVVFDTDYHGVSISVIDGGVGMTREELMQAAALLRRGQREADLTELGNPPKTGFAVCGVLAARYGFRVTLDSGSSRGGLRATLFLPTALLTTVEDEESDGIDETPAHGRREDTEREPVAASWPSARPAEPTGETTAGGLPKRRRAAHLAAEPTFGAPSFEPPAADAPPPDPGPPLRTADSSADNLRAFQQGGRLVTETRPHHDD